MKMTMSAIATWFAVPRKSTRLYLSLTLVACEKIQIVDSTVFACSSVVCPAFIALLNCGYGAIKMTMSAAATVRRLVHSVRVIVNLVTSFPEYTLRK